ncbi:hypothetical protein [Phenylobacterium sp.]|uniref:hypothetical protein n=1 Tax=Phenylobacterium sp. TaxID=1871053 RepID=UPI00391C8AAA
MPYFIQMTFDGHVRGYWLIEDTQATRLGVTNPENSPGGHFKAEPGETVWDAMRRGATSWFEGPHQDRFVQTELNPGEYYPRIARPLNPGDSPGFSPLANHKSLTAMCRGQLSALLRRLATVCEIIHPAGRNMSAFGHEIRHLLILASTEAESQWRSILELNEYCRTHYNTNDYVKLSEPLRLREYTIEFGDYPWLGTFRPYERWGTTGRPTQELPWYEAYNFTKHDREGKFHEATLEFAFNAVAACVVIACAQFGTHEALGLGELRMAVYPVELPKWEPSQFYIGPFGGDSRAKPFPFTSRA